MHFTLSSNAFWGETGDGVWTIRVMDLRSGASGGVFEDWSLRLYGDAQTADDVYIYTNEYSDLVGDASRTVLSDAGGVDTMNMAAVTSDTVLSLVPGTVSTLGGETLTIAGGTVIENAFLGDGDDVVTGNAAANAISGGRGDDTVAGGAGDDVLDGGADVDTVVFGGNFSDYFINIVDSITVTVEDLVSGNGDDGMDWVTAFERFLFGDEAYVFDGEVFTPEGGGPPPPPPPESENGVPDAVDDSAETDQDVAVTIDVLTNDSDPDGDTLVLSGIVDTPDHGSVVVHADYTVTYTPDEGWFGVDTLVYGVDDGNGGNDEATVTVTVNEVVAPPPPPDPEPNDDPDQELVGSRKDDVLDGGSGNDTLDGKRGDDTLDGHAGDDRLLGGYGDDLILGGSGDDFIDGGKNLDTIVGGEGADTLTGYTHDTEIFVYESLADAGDTILDFGDDEDVLDVRVLMDSIHYFGADPVGDGVLDFVVSGGDLQVFVDADGGGLGAPVLLATLDGASDVTLDVGVDVWV